MRLRMAMAPEYQDAFRCPDFGLGHTDEPDYPPAGSGGGVEGWGDKVLYLNHTDLGRCR